LAVCGGSGGFAQLLTDHPGEVVTRERLVQVLRRIVDFDNSLNGLIRKLRVALSDDSETPR
jgi:DNA-binding winged helix-turn-helix (wHTH) protein